MINETPSETKKNKEPSEQALLAEYQVLQHDNNSCTLEYWTLAGIFIGISSVLLGGLLYAIISNIQAITTISAKDICTLKLVISVLGAAIILILLFLLFWLKRVNYLMDINYWRMREIELRLGMWKSWRVHSIDKWNKMRRKLGFKTHDKLSDENLDKIWQKTLEGEKEGEQLAKGLSEESLGLLADRQEELFEICYRCKPQHWYEQPSRYLHFPRILCILIALWIFVIVMSFIIY